MVYLGIKNIAMLKSMKKPDPKKKVLSVEELAKSVKYPGSKTPVKKETTIVKVNPMKPADLEESETSEGIRKNTAYTKQQLSDISERASMDYGRNTQPGQDTVYNREEMIDQINKPSLNKTLQALREKRAKFEEAYKAKTKPKSK